MTDVPDGAIGATPQEAEFMKKMFDFFLHFSEANRSQEGGASSSNLFNVPEKDKKTPKKKKKEPNKKLEALKKKAVDEKAKHSKTVKELRDLQLLAIIERREKLVQKRKSLVQKDEEVLQMLKEKINKKTTQ